MEKEKSEKMPDNEMKERKTKKAKKAKKPKKKPKKIIMEILAPASSKGLHKEKETPLRMKQFLGLKYGTGMNRDIPAMGGAGGSSNLAAALGRNVGSYSSQIITPDQMKLQQDVTDIKSQHRMANEGVHVVEGQIVTPEELNTARTEATAEAITKLRKTRIDKGGKRGPNKPRVPPKQNGMEGDVPGSISQMTPSLGPPPLFSAKSVPDEPDLDNELLRSTPTPPTDEKLKKIAKEYIYKVTKGGEQPTDQGDYLKAEFIKRGLPVPKALKEVTLVVGFEGGGFSSPPAPLRSTPPGLGGFAGQNKINLHPGGMGLNDAPTKINATSFADFSHSLVGKQELSGGPLGGQPMYNAER